MDELLPYLTRRLTALLDSVSGAPFEMTGEENVFCGAKTGVNSRELLHDLRTVPLFLDHALDTLDLPPDSGEPTN